jgi:hypothetical protein
MRAKPVVVLGIVAQQTAQMVLIDDDQVIQAIPSDRSDQGRPPSADSRTRSTYPFPVAALGVAMLRPLTSGHIPRGTSPTCPSDGGRKSEPAADFARFYFLYEAVAEAFRRRWLK